MNRRTLGRGRLIVAIGSLVVLAGCVLPWYTIGGIALPALSGNAFEGAGIVVFVVAIALLSLVALPYASRDGHVALDRPASFVLVTGIGLVGFVLRIFELHALGVLSLPDRALGLWLTGVALLIVIWGVGEVVGERSKSW